MRTTVKVFSIISVVIGALAILGSPTAGYDAAGNVAFGANALIGGALFLVQGVLTLVYLSQE